MSAAGREHDDRPAVPIRKGGRTRGGGGTVSISDKVLRRFFGS